MFDRRKIGVCVFRVGAEEGIDMVSKDHVGYISCDSVKINNKKFVTINKQ